MAEMPEKTRTLGGLGRLGGSARVALVTLSIALGLHACTAPKVEPECASDADCAATGRLCVFGTCQARPDAGAAGGPGHVWRDAGSAGQGSSDASRPSADGSACVRRAPGPDAADTCLVGAIRTCGCGGLVGEAQCRADGRYGSCQVGGRPICVTCPTVLSNRSPLVLVAPTLGEAFCIDEHEATQREYAHFLGDLPPGPPPPPECAHDRTFEPTAGCFTASDLPLACVDWCDALAFCTSQGKRLCGRSGGGSLALGGCRDASEWHQALGSPDVTGLSDAPDEWIDACSGAAPAGAEPRERECQAAPAVTRWPESEARASIGVRCCADAVPIVFRPEAGVSAGGASGAGGAGGAGGVPGDGGASGAAAGGGGIRDAATSG